MVAALVTDSACGLPRAVCDQLGLELVDLRLLIDDQDRADSAVSPLELEPHLSGAGRVPTSQPSPAAFSAAYQEAAGKGADVAWSIHPGETFSGTINSARLAAHDSPIEVRVVDTGTISMAQGLCVLRALATLDDDPSADVYAVIRMEMATQESVFVGLTPALLASSGRTGSLRFDAPLPVIAMREGAGMSVVGRATHMEEAMEMIVSHVNQSGAGQTLAVGQGCARAWGDRLAEALGPTAVTSGASLFRYEVPASVTAQAGPTVGVVISAAALPPTLLKVLLPKRAPGAR